MTPKHQDTAGHRGTKTVDTATKGTDATRTTATKAHAHTGGGHGKEDTANVVGKSR